jgi:GT2 family glycosyltransferase
MLMQRPLVAAVVAVHNNIADTIEFLDSARKLTYPNYRTIIIDDGSSDGTEETIKRDYPEVILLAGDGNLWQSGGINLGIDQAIKMEAKYVVIVDNDTVVDPEFTTAMVDVAEKNPDAIISPKVYYYHQSQVIQSAGWRADRWRVNFARIGDGETDTGQYDIPNEIDCVTMGAFISIDILNNIGAMDVKNMPQYGADQDFALRATGHGYRILYEPKSKIWHKEQGTVSQKLPENKSFREAFKYWTTDFRSSLNFRMRMVFTFRHVPFYIIPWVLWRYFLDLMKASITGKR